MAPACSAQGPLGARWVCSLHVTAAKAGPLGAQSSCVMLSQDWGHWLGPSRAGMVTIVFCCPQQNQGCVGMGVNMSPCHHSMAVHCGSGPWVSAAGGGKTGLAEGQSTNTSPQGGF